MDWKVGNFFCRFIGGSRALGPINDKWRGPAVVVFSQREENASGCHLSSAFYEQNCSDPRTGGGEIRRDSVRHIIGQISRRRLHV
jgi:hypothetical protein